MRMHYPCHDVEMATIDVHADCSWYDSSTDSYHAPLLTGGLLVTSIIDGPGGGEVIPALMVWGDH